MTFLEKLDMLMEHKRINKHKLSIMSEVPYTTIDGFYKKGYENAKISTIRKIAKALDVSLDFLIESEADIMPYAGIEKAPSDELSKEAKQIGRAFDRATEDQKHVVRLTLKEHLDVPTSKESSARLA